MQAAGQIADLGGGALMAAFGIMAALRERDGGPGHPGSGEGQMVDVSMSDGALSWLAMVAGAYFADGIVPQRGKLLLAGSVICYRPYECADGGSPRRAGAEVLVSLCRGRVGREELIAGAVRARGLSRRTSRSRRSSGARTREQWEAFAREHDCCLEPVLELDEALDSELVRSARDGGRDRAARARAADAPARRYR